jgi:hypothetical protein
MGLRAGLGTELKLFHYMPWSSLGGKEVQLLLILDLDTGLGGGDQRHTWPCFSPGEWTPGTHFTGGWAGTRASLDTEATGNIAMSDKSRKVWYDTVKEKK